MDVALNNLQWLACHKKLNQTNQLLTMKYQLESFTPSKREVSMSLWNVVIMKIQYVV